MSWTDSLIRISDYQVETLQKRLAEIAGRRATLDMRLAALHAEAEAEAANARGNAEAGWYHVGFLQGWRMRKQAIETQMRETEAEELGAREALSEAFEELKKYEQVAEQQRLITARDAARRATAAMDELGLRQAVGR